MLVTTTPEGHVLADAQQTLTFEALDDVVHYYTDALTTPFVNSLPLLRFLQPKQQKLTNTLVHLLGRCPLVKHLICCLENHQERTYFDSPRSLEIMLFPL